MFKKILILISVITVFWSCFTDVVHETVVVDRNFRDYTVPVSFGPSADNTWTVMIYIAADNDLESYALTDFAEIKTGMARLGTNAQFLNVVVLIDRSSGYDSSDLEGENFSEARVYDITSSGAVLKENLGEINTGDGSILQNFLSNTKSDYVADNYALILWNHGGGAKGGADFSSTPESNTKAVCYDSTSLNDALYLNEIQTAVNNVFSDGSLKIIGFDACYMGTVEVAYEFRNLASYMAASMNTEWGYGWDYERLFGDMTGSNSSAEEFAKLMVRQYRESTNYVSSQTLSAVDLSKMESLKTAVDDLASKLALENKNSQIALTRNSSTHFFLIGDSSQEKYYAYFDLSNFANNIVNDSNYSTTLREKAQGVIDAMALSVVSSYAGSSYGGYYNIGSVTKRGLSILFPVNYYSSDYYWYSFDPVGNSGEIDFCNVESTVPAVNTYKEWLDFFFSN